MMFRVDVSDDFSHVMFVKLLIIKDGESGS